MHYEEAKKQYKEIENKVLKLVGFRGTLEEIKSKLQEIAVRDNIALEPFEDPLEGNDFGFNTNLGEIKDIYFDFEIYMLKTNKESVYLITEANRF